MCLLLALFLQVLHSGLSNSDASVKAALETSNQARVEYLRQFGYLSTTDTTPRGVKTFTSRDQITRWEEEEETLEEVPVIGAATIRVLQEYADVPQTGDFDEATLEMMATPRCQNPDLMDTTMGRFFLGEIVEEVLPEVVVDQIEMAGGRSRGRAEGRESIRTKRAVYIGPKWEKKALTYRVTGVKDQDRTRVEGLIGEAFETWSEYSQLSFLQLASTDGTADISLSFEEDEHAPPLGCMFDGTGGVLAHAFYPSAGRVHFDNAEDWSDDCVLYTVALHEIGHVLGLGHATDKDSIMFAYFNRQLVLSSCKNNARRPLAQPDVKAIWEMYGVVEGVDPLAVLTTTPWPFGSDSSTVITTKPSTTHTHSGSEWPELPATGASWELNCGEVREGALLDSPVEALGTYPAGANCTWLVENPSGTPGITVHVLHLDLEERNRDGGCYADLLTITDGVTEEVLCGNGTALMFPYPDATSISLNFRSDGLIERTGFRIYFTYAKPPPCAINVYQARGEVDIRWVRDQLVDGSCDVIITSPATEKTVMAVMTTEEGAVVEFGEGNSLHLTVTANTPPSKTLWFFSVWESTIGSCAFDRRGTWSPELVGGSYLHDMDCLLQGGGEGEVIVSVYDIDIEEDKLCSYDFVEVFTVEEGSWRLCGRAEDLTLTTQYPFLVYYHTDATEEREGVTVRVRSSCGFSLDGSGSYGHSGWVQHFIPAVDIPRRSNCPIELPHDHEAYFICGYVDLKPRKGKFCKDNFLSVSEMDSEGYEYTYEQCKGSFHQFGDEDTTLTLHTGNKVRGEGVQLSLLGIRTECWAEYHFGVPERLGGPSTAIDIKNSGESVWCAKRLTTEPGYSLRVKVVKMKPNPCSRPCDYGEGIEVIAGDCSSDPVERLCRRNDEAILGQEGFLMFSEENRRCRIRLFVYVEEGIDPLIEATTEAPSISPVTAPEIIDEFGIDRRDRERSRINP